MSTEQNQKLAERNIPGMMNRRERFAEPEHAENTGATVRRIVTYFMRERTLVICMLAIVISGTLCGIFAPSLQSHAVDIIAGEKAGIFPKHCFSCFPSICSTASADCCRVYAVHGLAGMW